MALDDYVEKQDTQKQGINIVAANRALSKLEWTLKKYISHSWANPAPKEELISRLSNSKRAKRALEYAMSVGLDTSAGFDTLFSLYDCRYIPRDENGNFSISEGQAYWIYHDLPTDGILAMPLDAYLRKRGVDRTIASKAHNALMRSIESREFLLTCPRRAIVTLAIAAIYLNGATIDDLLKIRNVGEQTAESILKAIHDPEVEKAVADHQVIKTYMLLDHYRLHKTGSK